MNSRGHASNLDVPFEEKMNPILRQSSMATLRNRPMQSMLRRSSTLPFSRPTATWFNSCCVRPAAVAFGTPGCCGNSLRPRALDVSCSETEAKKVHALSLTKKYFSSGKFFVSPISNVFVHHLYFVQQCFHHLLVNGRVAIWHNAFPILPRQASQPPVQMDNRYLVDYLRRILNAFSKCVKQRRMKKVLDNTVIIERHEGHAIFGKLFERTSDHAAVEIRQPIFLFLP